MRAAHIAGLLAGVALAISAFSLASHAETLTLTPEQTVALYGTSITGTFHGAANDSNNGEITFHYAFPLSSVGYQQAGGGFDYSTVPSQFQNEIRNMQGCVYIAQSSDWGGAPVFPTTNYNPGQHDSPYYCNLRLPMTINIGTYTDLTQYFAWSTGSWDYTYQTSNANFRAVRDWCPWECYNVRPVQGRQMITDGHALGTQGDTAIGAYVRTGLALLPLYSYDGTGTVDESQLANFSFHRVFATTQTVGLPVNEIDLGCQMLQQVHGGSGAVAPSGDIWLVVGCPKLSDHVPPTTTPAQTTRAPHGTGVTGVTGIGTTQTSADLESISVDLREIILNQRWQIQQNEIINENARITANNTNEIVRLLNLIYEAMLQGGEIPVDNTSQMYAAVESAIGGYTTARIPEQAESGLRFWAALLEFINSVGWIAGLGAFSLAMSVTCWVLFRGRNA